MPDAKTQEELAAELKEAQAQLGKLETQVVSKGTELEKARNEAASYRNQRNVALRKLHASETVISKHNIKFDLNQADLGGLAIKDGKVEGEFEYSPGKPDNSPPKKDGDTKEALTYADVQKMDRHQMQARWDEVQKVMEAGPPTE